VKSFRTPSKNNGHEVLGCGTCVTESGRYVSVEFEVLTAVPMKSSVIWDVTPYSPVKVIRLFGGTYHHRLQGRNKPKKETSMMNASSCLISSLALNIEAACSSETLGDTPDYMALYPRRYNYSYVSIFAVP
jgi:hypothetical protein